MENYKEKYENLIEKLKKAKEEHGGYTFSSVIDKIVHELRESEDERIREEIIAYLKDRDFDIEESWLAWLEKQGEQKPAEWSEEDNDMLDKVIHRIEQLDHYWNKPTDEKMINWLKSLKDKVQPKQEWNKEDKTMLNCCLGAVNTTDYFDKDNKDEMKNWLKSLRPQNHWKPSEAEMRTFEEVINNVKNGVQPYCSEISVIEDLFKELKNL